MSTSEWLSDFTQLRASLTQQYANLDWAVERRGVRLNELSRATETALRASQSDAAARTAIESFLNAFGDGHLEVRWASGGEATPEPARPHQAVCERLGYHQARRGGGIRFELIPGFRWLTSADSVYFPAGVMIAGSERTGVLRIASFEDNIYPELCAAATRVLHIREDDECSDTCSERVAREAGNQLTAVLERRIAELQAEGVTRLLVDITRNGGGTNWVEAAARTLTGVPLHGARAAFIRHQHYVEMFDTQIRDVLRDSLTPDTKQRARYGQALASLREQRREASEPCDRSSLWDGRESGCWLVVKDPPRYSTGILAYAAPGEVDTTEGGFALFSPAQYRYREGVYRGPLLVVVDGGTASAAEYFAALIMDNKAGVVVGAPTFGAGCGYTNGGIRLVLSHSHARVMVPDCVRYRQDGLNEVEGVTPTLSIPWRRNDSPLQRARRVVEIMSGVK